MQNFLVALILVAAVTAKANAQDKCAGLLREVQEIDQQIADIGAERALTESVRDMTGSLNAAIDDINKSKDDAAAYQEKLEDLEELLGEKYEQLGEVVKGTKAGTEKLKKALGDTSDGLSKAQLTFKLYLEKRKVGDNADPAESLQTLADSYDFLQSALGPLIDEVPVIGQFLKAYGEALKSAAKIASQLQKQREKQADLIDQIPELNGGNPFRFPTAKDNRLKELESRRAKLLVALRQDNCGEPDIEEEIPDEVKQARIAARRQCLKDLNLDPDPYDAYISAAGKKDKILAAYYTAVKAESSAASDIPQKERTLATKEQFAKTADDTSNSRLAFLKIEPGYQNLLTRIQKVAPGFPETNVIYGCTIADGLMDTLPNEPQSVPPGLKSAMQSFCKMQPDREKKRKEAEDARQNLAQAKETLAQAKKDLQRLSDESVQASREIRTARQNQDRLEDCVFSKSDPIDISGRYWSRYTEDILTVRRVGPNYVINYEEPSQKEQNLRGVKKNDEWFIGRLEDGKLKGIYRQRFPLSVQTDWGCTNRGGWVNSQAIIWASGEWLSVTAETKYINGNCELSKAGDTFTIYKEGSKSYKRFKP